MAQHDDYVKRGVAERVLGVDVGPVFQALVQHGQLHGAGAEAVHVLPVVHVPANTPTGPGNGPEPRTTTTRRCAHAHTPVSACMHASMHARAWRAGANPREPTPAPRACELFGVGLPEQPFEMVWRCRADGNNNNNNDDNNNNNNTNNSKTAPQGNIEIGGLLLM